MIKMKELVFGLLLLSLQLNANTIELKFAFMAGLRQELFRRFRQTD